MSNNRKRLLVISPVDPVPNRDGFQYRVADMTRGLTDSWEQHLLVYGGCRRSGDELFESVTAIDAPAPSMFRKIRRRIVTPSADNAYYRDPNLLDRVEALHRQHPFDACIVHTPILAHALDALPREVTRVVDAHDIWHKKYLAYHRVEQGELLAHYREPEAEITLYKKADFVLSISTADDAYLNEAGLSVVYTPISQEPVVVGTEPVEPTLLYAGGRGVTNIDAVRFFIRHVLPIVKVSVPEARLLITSADEALHDEYGDHPAVELLPFMENVNEAYRRAKVVVVPLRIGTGLKIKVLESMARRRATLVTPVAAEGIELASYPQEEITDDPDGFAKQVARALLDPQYRHQLAGAGVRIISERYSRERAYAKLKEALALQRSI